MGLPLQNNMTDHSKQSYGVIWKHSEPTHYNGVGYLLMAGWGREGISHCKDYIRKPPSLDWRWMKTIFLSPMKSDRRKRYWTFVFKNSLRRSSFKLELVEWSSRQSLALFLFSRFCYSNVLYTSLFILLIPSGSLYTKSYAPLFHFSLSLTRSIVLDQRRKMCGILFYLSPLIVQWRS